MDIIWITAYVILGTSQIGILYMLFRLTQYIMTINARMIDNANNFENITIARQNKNLDTRNALIGKKFPILKSNSNNNRFEIGTSRYIQGYYLSLLNVFIVKV